MSRIYYDKRTDWWCMDYKDVNGWRRQVKAARTKSQAETVLHKKLDEIQQELILGRKNTLVSSFPEFAKEYLEKYSKINKRSWDRDELSLRHLVDFFGEKNLDEITPKDVERYKAERSTLVKKATVNRELACFKHLYTIAIQWGYARESPGKKVKLFKENNQRTRFLQSYELDRLYAVCFPGIRPIVKFAANTGMRFGEIMSLKWADVDLRNNIIMVKNTKNNQPREIPLNPDSLDAINSVPRHINEPYVFCNQDGSKRSSIRTSFENAVRKAGLEDVVFHTLRHSFASNLVMAGVDIATVKELMGHKDIQMTMRYSHLSQPHKKEALARLSRHWNQDRNATLMQHGDTAESAVALKVAQ